MKTTILILAAFLFFSCSDSTEKVNLQYAKQQAEYERDRLLLEKKNNILRHLKEYLPVTTQITLESELLGGFNPGTVFIENKTGYDVENAVVALDFFKANGQLYNTQFIEFNNLRNGDSQSKPSSYQARGTDIRHRIVKIIGSELTNGQEISSR